MCRGIVLLITVGWVVLLTKMPIADEQLATIEVSRTVYYQAGELDAEQALFDYWGVRLPNELDHWVFEYSLDAEGKVAWEVVVDAPWTLARPFGDNCTMLIGDLESKPDELCFDLYAMQEYTAPTEEPYCVSGSAKLRRPINKLGFILIPQMKPDTVERLLRGEYRELYEHDYHIARMQGLKKMERYVTNKSLEPLGENRYRYRAEMALPFDPDSIDAQCVPSVELDFADQAGWIAYRIRCRCDPAVFRGEQPITGEITCQQELADFSVLSEYNEQSLPAGELASASVATDDDRLVSGLMAHVVHFLHINANEAWVYDKSVKPLDANRYRYYGEIRFPEIFYSNIEEELEPSWLSLSFFDQDGWLVCEHVYRDDSITAYTAEPVVYSREITCDQEIAGFILINDYNFVGG